MLDVERDLNAGEEGVWSAADDGVDHRRVLGA